MPNILVVGLGNSNLAFELHQGGFKQVTAVDFCSSVVSQMQLRHKGVEGLRYMVADVLNMTSFKDESYDCIIDKGCLVRKDVLTCLFFV